MALTIVAIALHESGHFLVYALAGVPTRITLQSVHAAGPVDPTLDAWAKTAGPAMSVIAAILLLAIARRRSEFGWVTAAFTNGSLRIFPMAMDFLRAAANAHPFSDEGDVVYALTTRRNGRIALLLVPAMIYLVLTGLAGREYHFRTKGVLKTVGIYLLTIVVGIGIIIVDELLQGSAHL